MTEAEWRDCADPAPLLEHLKAIDPLAFSSLLQEARRQGEVKRLRKAICFGIACCRRVWHFLVDETARHLIEIAERYVDGESTWQAIVNASSGVSWFAPLAPAWSAAHQACWHFPRFDLVSVARDAALALGYEVAYRGGRESSWTIDRPAAIRAEQAVQASLVRDVFGNPFRPVTLETAWFPANGGLVRTMAQVIYAEQRFEDLPILADALEDAGCDNAEILAHCRGPEPHVRGCWVLDAILQQE